LLALVFLAGASGWIANADGAPDWLSEIHEGIASMLLAMIGVHIAGAVASSLLHRENLIRAMLTGYKNGGQREAIANARWFTAMVLVAGVVALWVLVI
jgi:cytochrome b